MQTRAVSPLSLDIAPSLTQVADAILAHYGPHHVGSHYYDDLRDATMVRKIAAARLLKAARHDVRAAIAAIDALSLETAHETPFDSIDETDADGETRVVEIRPAYSAPGNRVAAWEANPRCVYCGETIDDPRNAGALYGSLPLRVAHVTTPGSGSSCFIHALANMRNLELVKSIIPRALDRSGLEIR